MNYIMFDFTPGNPQRDNEETEKRIREETARLHREKRERYEQQVREAGGRVYVREAQS